MDDELGRYLLDLLGERGCVELLALLELLEAERAAGRPHPVASSAVH